MLYFAYGSNLSTTRFSARIPSSELVSRGYLLQHRLCFHKVGKDGSAKCDALETGSDHDNVMGAVYRIDPEHKELLDKFEGLGYEEKDVAIITDAGEKMGAITYCATHIDTNLKPYHWYKGHVLIGAREHEFPEDYIAHFMTIPSIDDPDTQRAARELAIHGISRSGPLGRIQGRQSSHQKGF